MREFNKSAGGVLMPVCALAVGGIFTGQIVRQGEVIDEFECPNLVTDQGLNNLLDVYFHGATQISTWYLGLFSGNYTPVAGNTAATFPAAATEVNAQYSQATRPEFNEAAPAAKSITNSANKATFTFTDPVTIYGAFLVSDAAKGGVAGTLFSAAKFAAPKAVVATDELLLTYTFNAASA